MSKTEQLAQAVEKLLLDSGFPKDHFFVKVERERVKVLFDLRSAVDYFKGDFDYSHLAEDHFYYYERDGRRHCAVII
jgi:hypothetical protein